MAPIASTALCVAVLTGFAFTGCGHLAYRKVPAWAGTLLFFDETRELWEF